MRGGCVKSEKCLHFCSLCTWDNRLTNEMAYNDVLCDCTVCAEARRTSLAILWEGFLCKWHSPPSLTHSYKEASLLLLQILSLTNPSKLPYVAEAAFHGWNMTRPLLKKPKFKKHRSCPLTKLSHMCYKTLWKPFIRSWSSLGKKKKDQLNVYFMSLGWKQQQQTIRWLSRTHPGHISMPVKGKKGNCEIKFTKK